MSAIIEFASNNVIKPVFDSIETLYRDVSRPFSYMGHEFKKFTDQHLPDQVRFLAYLIQKTCDSIIIGVAYFFCPMYVPMSLLLGHLFINLANAQLLDRDLNRTMTLSFAFATAIEVGKDLLSYAITQNPLQPIAALICVVVSSCYFKRAGQLA